MRKLLYMMLTALAIQGCRKSEEEPAPVTPQEDAISPVPSAFSQKVLLEIFTGAGQPQCTDGFVKEDDIVNSYGSIAIPLRIHYSDGMEIPYYTTMETTFNSGTPPSFPSAMINRLPSLGTVILNRTQWMSNFLLAKGKTAGCGLAIKSSIAESQVTIEVHAGFSQALTGTYTMTVLLAESNVTGTGNQYDQRNSYNTTSGHPYYNAGDPIVGYSHAHALRKALSSDLGDAIPQSSLTSGGEYVKTYTANISSYKKEDLYIIAFITRTGSSATTYEVMNVQKVKAGNLKDWD